MHRTQLAGGALSLLLAAATAACGGTHGATKAPATAAAAPRAPQPHRAPAAPPPAGPGASRENAPPQGGAPNQQGEEEDAELVVSRDVVAACPTLRLVRAHVDEFDPDMVWLAVLEAVADCMSEDGPMSQQSIGVSGDEEHRHVVREVLQSRGVDPSRVVAKPPSAQGAAECQGGEDCNKRVEITIQQ